jgi:uncharacterized protein YegL
MSLLEEITPAPRKVMTLFYLVDTSGSMTGEKMGTVNAAMEECCTTFLKEVATANDDAEIKVAILQFSSGNSWVTPISGPVALDDLYWNDLQPGGLTEFGPALLELDGKLSRNEYLKSQTGAYAPVILLLSDGAPTDENWESALDKIKQNNWFKHAIKIALDIQIDGGSDRNVLSQFTGDVEAIIDVHDTATLKKVIHKVSVRASEFQSHSKQSQDTVSSPVQDSIDIANAVKEEVETEAGEPNDWDDDWGNW